MIAASKIDYEVAARRGARQAHRAHRRLLFRNSRIVPFRQDEEPSSGAREFDFKFSGHAVTGAPCAPCGNGFDDFGCA